MERHHSNHGTPSVHSNPHDHIINWGPSGNPVPGNQINYWDGNVSVFKSVKGVYNIKDNLLTTLEQNAFKTIAEFQSCMRDGGEVQFTYNGKDYSVFGKACKTPESDVRMLIVQQGNDDSELWCDTSDELLDYIIDDKKLREIIKEVEVFDRTI
jgi:hypothetical protein